MLKKYAEPNLFQNFEKIQVLGFQITKMSQFSKIKTSPALPPYYSLKSTGICSTSHLSIVLEARRRQHMRQHEKNEKNESQNSSE